MSGASEMSSRPVSPVVIGAMLGLWLCWGSSFPAIRVMVTSLPPLISSGAIFLTAGVVLAASRPHLLRTLDRGQYAVCAGVGAFLLGAQGSVAVAEQYVYASTAALLVAVTPLWVVLLRSAVGERPTRAGMARLLVGFAGVAAVLLTSAGGGLGWSAWGLLVVAAAVSWAVGTLWASRSSLPDPRAAAAVQLVCGGLLLLVLGTLGGELEELVATPVRSSAWAAFGYLVVVDSLAGFVLYNWLLTTAPVALVSTYAYAVPVVAYLVGVAVLGEPFHPPVLLGAAAIVAAVAAEVRSAR
ncbi:EamA family transporter [Streptomyces sp. NPDC048057]|uniref:EamA family transporter n=1 Tax=Streptomyces sp. NPDC048057 TaxID=3155628 RepID=UPI0033F61EE2